MTREEAALILDPETSRDALLPYESQEERIAVCEEACRLGAAALREQEERRWIPVTERLPENGQKVVFFNCSADAVYAGKFNYIGKRGTVWFRAGKTSYPGSYWMPLPEPPKEGTR